MIKSPIFKECQLPRLASHQRRIDDRLHCMKINTKTNCNRYTESKIDPEICFKGSDRQYTCPQIEKGESRTIYILANSLWPDLKDRDATASDTSAVNVCRSSPPESDKLHNEDPVRCAPHVKAHLRHVCNGDRDRLLGVLRILRPV